MSKWTVPVIWEMTALVEVEADSLGEAMDMAEYDNTVPMLNASYIDSSLGVFGDIEFIRHTYNDGRGDDETEQYD